MGIKCGIVGLPNVGKSTLFNALTAAEIPAENYPFCTIDPNVGVVTVPDPKLDALAAIVKPEKVVPTVVEFVDIAGLVEGASQGQGLGNQFLAHIRETHAIAHLVRCFVNDDIVHVSGKINPLHDIEIIDTELMLADLESVQKVHQRAEKAAKTNDKAAVARRDALKMLLTALENGKPARSVTLPESEAAILNELHLITAKPVMYIANVAENSPADNPMVAAVRKLAAEQGAEVVVICAAIEAELAQLPEQERAEFLSSLGLEEPGLNRVIRSAYKLLGLKTFYTAGPKEVRAWTVRRDATAPQAAGAIHTDFERGFIRAEVIGYDQYIARRGEQGAREAGELRLEGKTYVVQEGDVHVMVLGAGLLGVTSAYFLRQQGHDVTVVDRQATPAAETSFANGGQISVSHAEPWANPSAPLKVLKWMTKEDAPLLFRPRADLRQWLWTLQFLRECTPGRTRHNIECIVRLGTYSREMLQQLRRDIGIDYDQRTQGILHFYTSAKELAAAEGPAAQMRALGCDRRLITVAEALAIEPALRHIAPKLAGATYTAQDESGDANRFARELVEHCQADGVRFLMSHTVTALRASAGKLDHVEATDAEGRFQFLHADAYVLAMGSWSPLYVRPLGVRLPIYPAKGYSVTMPVRDPTRAFQVSLTDDEHKIVFSRLGDKLRIAGTAELNGYDRDLNRVRCEAIVRRTEELFPGAGDPERAQFWTGLRPATPSNVPIVGRSKLRNLYLNTGHGTLGWTHACGSGKSVAHIVSGQKPEVDFPFVGV